MSTHTIMKKSLAKALMDAGMEHFDLGGEIIKGAEGLYGGVLGGGYLGQALGTSRPDTSSGGIMNAFSSGLYGALGGNIGGGLTNNFQAADPRITTQDFVPDIKEQQKRQADIYNQQQNLAQALLAQSQGQGVSPAQAMLNQQTGQNVAQTGALLASQRGASANPALIARLAAQQGAGIQQAGLGQAATLRAQEQLAAQNALANQQAQMANQALSAQNILQGGIAAQNTAQTTGQLGAQNVNANVAAANQATRGGILGGVLGGVGAALGGGLFYKGGEVQKKAFGGPIESIPQYSAPYNPEPVSMHQDESGNRGLKMGLTNLGGGLGQLFGAGGGAAAMGAGETGGAGLLAGGAMDAGGIAELAPLLLAAKDGGKVPGKAEKKGNSEDNDNVPALLSPGEIVLPRSVTQAPDMEKKAMEFLKHLKKNKSGYEKVANARKEKMAYGGKC